MADHTTWLCHLLRRGPGLLLAVAVAADVARAATSLSPGQSLEREIESDKVHEYQVEIGRGSASDLRLIQIEPLLTLHFSGPDGTELGPFKTQSGRFGLIGLTLAAGGDAAGIWRIRITPDRPGVKYRLTLSPTRPAHAEDDLRSNAERAFWNAEVQRRALKPESGTAAFMAAEQAYGAAITNWRKAGEDCGLLLARTGLARLHFAGGKFARARNAAEQALHHSCLGEAELADAAETAAAQRTLASALGYLGKLDAAAEAHRAALALYERTGDARFQGVVLGNLAAVERERGATGAALEAAMRSAELARQSNDREGVAFALEAAASIRLARGELGAAQQAYRQVLDELATTPYPMIEGQSWNNLGILYARTDDFPAARLAFDRALAIWDETGHRSGHADTLISLGGLLLDTGDPTAAQSAFQQALEIGETDQLLMTQAHAHLGLGRSVLIAGQAALARHELERALELARQANDADVRTEAELLLGDLSAQPAPKTAKAHYQRALALSRQAGDRWSQAIAHASLARLAIATGEPAQGRADIERAVELIEDQRRRIFDPALRGRYFASRRDIFDVYIDLLIALEPGPAGLDFGLEALEVAQRARAAATRDHFVERRADLEVLVDPALVAAERAAEDAVRVLARRQTEANSPVGKAEMNQALRALDDTRGRLRAAYPRYADLIRPCAPGIDEIQALLDEHTGLLEIWLGPRRSMVWLVLSDTVHGYPAPPRDQLEELAAQLRAGILDSADPVVAMSLAKREQWQTRQLTALTKIARNLGQSLLGQFQNLLGNRRLVVVADGALHAIPFGLLAPSGNALWRNHELVYLPSAGVLADLRELPEPAAPGRVAIFSDPVYSTNDRRLRQILEGSVAPSSVAELPASGNTPRSAVGAVPLQRLLHAGNEARAIQALVPNTVRIFSGFDASPERLLEPAVRQAGIVHFAAHARLDANHPELSGVALSLFGPDAAPRDGFLRAADLYRMQFDGALIVLGACNSALGPTPGAEGVFSLARAFQHAGARTVLASLWPVDDRASALFMAAFYRAMLREARPPAAALRIARRELANHPRYRMPYYWAGFVLQGDWH